MTFLILNIIVHKVMHFRIRVDLVFCYFMLLHQVRVWDTLNDTNVIDVTVDYNHEIATETTTIGLKVLPFV